MNWSTSGMTSSTAFESAGDRRSPVGLREAKRPPFSDLLRDFRTADGVVGVDQEHAVVAVLADERLERVPFPIEALHPR